MAESHSTPWQHRPAERSVVASTGTAVFAVHGHAWGDVSPGLPSDVAAMLAPPISVSSSPFTGPAVSRTKVEPVMTEQATTGQAKVGPAAGSTVDESRLAELAFYHLDMATAPPSVRHHRRSARVN